MIKSGMKIHQKIKIECIITYDDEKISGYDAQNIFKVT